MIRKLYFLSGILFIVTFCSNAQIQVYDNGALNAENNFVVGGTSWASNTITYYFANDTADIPGTTQEQNAVIQAFGIWAQYTNLSFIQGSSASNSDIVISWGIGNHGDGFDFDGVGGVLAHAFQPPANGTSHNLTGDIHFDDSETWTTAIRTNGTTQET